MTLIVSKSRYYIDKIYRKNYNKKDASFAPGEIDQRLLFLFSLLEFFQVKNRKILLL